MERARKDIVRLGARLANAVGFRVIALDGHEVGVLENVRYRQHMDHPDDLVITRRFLFWERRSEVKFEDVSAVDPDRERVYLAVSKDAITWQR
jgi:hypothetical protein